MVFFFHFLCSRSFCNLWWYGLYEQCCGLQAGGQQIFKLQYYKWVAFQAKCFSCAVNTWIDDCRLLFLKESDQITWTAGGYEVQHMDSSERMDSSGCHMYWWIICKAKLKFQYTIWSVHLVSPECCLQTFQFMGVCYTWFITVTSYWLLVNSGSDSGLTSASRSHATKAVNGSVFLAGYHWTSIMNNKIFVNHLC